LRLGTSLEDRPRYTPSSTFETFPFPEAVPLIAGADDNSAIATAARRLDELRENWLHPGDLVKRVPEIASGYPDRLVPISAKAAEELKRRTLTNLYNQNFPWLVDAHRDIDDAVASAYGWSPAISDDEAIGQLFEMNLARAQASIH
jgi:hypothetical protein